MNWKLLASAALFASLTGCGTEGAKTDDRVHIRGSVGQELRAPDMRAVAIAGDGRWFSTAIDTRGGFDLALPSGVAYRVVITQGKTIVARVVLEGDQGKTVWLKQREAGDVSFGLLHQAGLSTQTLGESENESESEGAEAEDDGKENENETAEAEEGDHDDYEACSSSDEKELEPTNPSAAAKSDYEEEADEKESACGS